MLACDKNWGYLGAIAVAAFLVVGCDGSDGAQGPPGPAGPPGTPGPVGPSGSGGGVPVTSAGKINVSITEVGDNDLWQRSVIGVSAVGNYHSFVNETLDKVADFVASMHGGQILVTDRAIEIVPYGGESFGAGFTSGERTLADVEGWDDDEP